MQIERLPQEVINRIAAGEVVQSPSAALKELIENSLDSGATRIAIAWGDAGLHTLRITDNGCGISAPNLPLVATRFATSKLRAAEDLQRITTFGFRGEAVAALSYVALLRFRTRGGDLLGQRSCHEAHYRNATLQSTEVLHVEDFPFPSPKGAKESTGTTVIVENMFYNASIRRAAFSSRKHEEANKLEEVVRHYAVANPGVGFTVTRLDSTPGKHGGPANRVTVTPDCADMLAVMQALYGAAFCTHMVPVDSAKGASNGASPQNALISIDGIVSDPFYSHPKAKQFVCFINKRLVRMPPCLRKVCEQFYAEILPKRHYPYAFLRVNVPPNAIDVNIHPTKSEVRILYEEQACALLDKVLRREVMGRLQAQQVGGVSPTHIKAEAPRVDYAPQKDSSPPQKVDRSVREFGQMERFVRKSDFVPTHHTSKAMKMGDFGEFDVKVEGYHEREMKVEKSSNPQIKVEENVSFMKKGEEIAEIHMKIENEAENEKNSKIPTNSIGRVLSPHAKQETTFLPESEDKSPHFTLHIHPAKYPNAKPRDPADEYLLSSVSSILSRFQTENAPEILQVLHSGTYVGCLTEQSPNSPPPHCHLFLQHNTSLYLIDGDFLVTNAAFQHIFWFWERYCWDSLNVFPAMHIGPFLENHTANGAFLTDILQRHRDMLAAYFHIELDETGRYLSNVPLLFGKTYVPNVSGFVLVLAQIAHVLSEDIGEEATLVRIAHAVAAWFAYRIDTRRMDSIDSQSGNEVNMTYLPMFSSEYFQVDKSADFSALRRRLLEIASVSVNSPQSQDKHDFLLHHGVLASLRRLKSYLPPNSQWLKQEKKGMGGANAANRIVCIATTEALYKVFERC